MGWRGAALRKQSGCKRREGERSGLALNESERNVTGCR
jgi:hypothetical protein